MKKKTYTVRPAGQTSWSTEKTIAAARKQARSARNAGLRRVVIVDDSTGEVVE